MSVLRSTFQQTMRKLNFTKFYLLKHDSWEFWRKKHFITVQNQVDGDLWTQSKLCLFFSLLQCIGQEKIQNVDQCIANLKCKTTPQ